MEGASRVTESVLASRELTEVLRGPGDGIVVELEDDAAKRLLVSSNVKLACNALVSITALWSPEACTYEDVGPEEFK